MKTIELKELKQMTGAAFRLPVLDANGDPIQTMTSIPDGKGGTAEIPSGKLKTADVTGLVPLLETFVLRGVKGEKLADVVMVNQVYVACLRAKADPNIKALELDDDVYTWLAVKLKDDKCGVAFFGYNMPVIYQAVTGEMPKLDK